MPKFQMSIIEQVDHEFGVSNWLPWVSEDEILAFDAAVRSLFSEMVYAFANPPEGKSIPFMPVNHGLYAEFMARWTLWEQQHTPISSRYGHEPRQQMNDFIREYNSFRATYKLGGGVTETRPVEEKRSWVEGIEAIGSTVKWVVIGIVAVAAAIYLPKGKG